MSDLERRRDNFLRKLDNLQRATDDGAAWLIICRADDAAASALVLHLTGLGYSNSVRDGLLVVATGQPGNRIWEGMSDDLLR